MDRSYSLAHYGVKGMKWGVRKRSRPSDGPQEITTKIRPGRRVKAAGGRYHGPSDDAVNAAIVKQKAKKSTVDALSNEELKKLVERMNLEQQYTNLSRQQAGFGEEFVARELKNFMNNPMGATNKYKHVGNVIKSSYERNLRK